MYITADPIAKSMISLLLKEEKRTISAVEDLFILSEKEPSQKIIVLNTVLEAKVIAFEDWFLFRQLGQLYGYQDEKPNLPSEMKVFQDVIRSFRKEMKKEEKIRTILQKNHLLITNNATREYFSMYVYLIQNTKKIAVLYQEHKKGVD